MLSSRDLPDESLSPQSLYWAERLKRAEYWAKQAEFEWAEAQRLKKLVAERWRPGIYQEQKLLWQKLQKVKLQRQQEILEEEASNKTLYEHMLVQQKEYEHKQQKEKEYQERLAYEQKLRNEAFACRKCPAKFPSNTQLHMHISEHHAKKSVSPEISPAKPENSTPAIIQKLSLSPLTFVEIQPSPKISPENPEKPFAAPNTFPSTPPTPPATPPPTSVKPNSPRCTPKKPGKSSSTSKNRARTPPRTPRYPPGSYMTMEDLFRKCKRARRYTRATGPNTRAFPALTELQAMVQTVVQTAMRAVFQNPVN